MIKLDEAAAILWLAQALYDAVNIRHCYGRPRWYDLPSPERAKWIQRATETVDGYKPGTLLTFAANLAKAQAGRLDP